jgi:hypothetical protein
MFLSIIIPTITFQPVIIQFSNAGYQIQAKNHSFANDHTAYLKQQIVPFRYHKGQNADTTKCSDKFTQLF